MLKKSARENRKLFQVSPILYQIFIKMNKRIYRKLIFRLLFSVSAIDYGDNDGSSERNYWLTNSYVAEFKTGGR